MTSIEVLEHILFGAVPGLVAFLLVRSKLKRELQISKKRQEELARKAYETAVLKEIGDRIGYSLDAAKIVEIISASLEELLPFSTASHLIVKENGTKVIFACNLKKSVSSDFVKSVKAKMLAAYSEITQNPLLSTEVDESITGLILDDSKDIPLKSFFNLPIIISSKLAGLITVASDEENLYNDENTEVLYRIAKQASAAVSKLQEVLENEKSRLSQAVQSLSDGLLMVDTNYHLLLVNQKISKLLGTVEPPRLFDIANALSGSLDLRSMIEQALASETELPVKEVTVKDKNLQVFVTKVMDKVRGIPLGVAVIFHDYTDAKTLEKLRSDFTSMMVHELRAPLTSIKSTVELINSDYSKISPQELGKYLSTIDATAMSMLEVVNDLLDVAKMEAGSFDVVCENGNLPDFIEERVEVFKPLAAAKNLKISAQIEENLPDAYFDKVRIKQVLNNLISNAIKFTQSGEIKLKAQKEGLKEVVISVSDTGIGIDREEGDKLFSRFGQLVRGRRTASLKGSGLGLYIAKGIVEAWGGRIWYKSDGPGMGTSFFFTVPVLTSASTLSPHKDQVVVSKVAQA